MEEVLDPVAVLEEATFEASSGDAPGELVLDSSEVDAQFDIDDRGRRVSFIDLSDAPGSS
jgi:hypothetical protein